MKEMKLSESMGKDLSPRDLKPMLEMASQIKSLYKTRE